YLQTVTLHELVPAAETAALDALIARAGKSSAVEKASLHLVKSLTYPISVELRVVKSSLSGVEGFAIAGFDVSEWHAKEERLIHELHHNRLTGLPSLSALIPAL